MFENKTNIPYSYEAFSSPVGEKVLKYDRE